MEKFNEDDGVWRTISGRKVFIRDGESLGSAMSRSGKFKTMSRVEKNKDKYDKIAKFKKRKDTNKLKEDKEFEHKKIVDFEVRDNRYIPIREGEDRNEVIKQFEQRENPDRIEIIKEAQDDDRTLRSGIHVSNNDEKEMQRAKAEKGKVVDYERRESLIKFTENNREQIDKWVSEYDDETDKKVLDKISKGQGLSLKEYYGYIARRPKEGDLIFGGGPQGQDVRIKNGKREIIKDYQRKKRSNK